MEIIWNPLTAFSDKDKIHITDNRNFKKDVLVIFKSFDPNKQIQKKSIATKQQGVHLVQKRPKIAVQMSASTAARKQSAEKILLQQNTINRQTNIKSYTTKFPPATEQERLPLGQLINRVEESNKIFTFSANNNNKQSAKKENISPVTPSNASAIFNQINFTPATSQTEKQNSHFDYLASLPTPTLEPRKVTYNLSPKKSSTRKVNAARQANIENENPEDLYWMSTQNPSSSDNSLLAGATTPTSTVRSATSILFIENIESTDLNLRRQLFDEKPSNKTYNIPNSNGIADNSMLPIITTNAQEINSLQANNIGKSECDNEELFHSIKNSPSATTGNTGNLTKNDITNMDISVIGTPLRKKYQSMRNLNYKLTAEQEILKINQGSMPNLNQIEPFKPLDNNRYYYQSIKRDVGNRQEDVIQEEQQQEPIEIIRTIKQQQSGNALEKHDSPELNLSGNSIISTKSINEIQFREHEILAQSSRFNLTVCHETPTARMPSIDLSAFSFERPAAAHHDKSQSEKSKPKQTKAKKAPSDGFVVPRQRTLSARSSTVRVPIIKKTAPTPPKKREREDSIERPAAAAHRYSFTYSPPKRSKPNCDRDSTISSVSRSSLSSIASSTSSTYSSSVSTWGAVKPKKIRIPRTSIQELVLKKQKEKRVILYNPELHLSS